MALYLLERNQKGAERLSLALSEALLAVKKCDLCRNLTDQTRCVLCQDSERNSEQLCIVESPGDVFALAKSVAYQGYYFVLYGHLSPLDGIGPQELGLHQLEERFKTGAIKELILATSSTVEGEATAYYLDELARPYNIEVTKIAHGIPLGGELEHFDGGTLAHAFDARKKI